jgi:hypothetical protein
VDRNIYRVNRCKSLYYTLKTKQKYNIPGWFVVTSTIFSAIGIQTIIRVIIVWL